MHSCTGSGRTIHLVARDIVLPPDQMQYAAAKKEDRQMYKKDTSHGHSLVKSKQLLCWHFTIQSYTLALTPGIQ